MTALLPPQDHSTFTDALLGDDAALEQLLREHRPAVEAVCFRRLRSRLDAEDAVQETMVKGIRSLHHVQDPTRLRSYLCRIAERVCLDMLRAGARSRPMQVEDIAPPVAAPHEEPEAQALEQERARLVHQALEALGERQAKALWMRDAMGEPVPAVAETLGVTEGSARVLLTRARAKMRDGWAKVAAILPGAGLKLPSFAAKAVHLGPFAIPAVPALLLVVAVAGSPVALQALADPELTLVRALSPDTSIKSSTPPPEMGTPTATPAPIPSQATTATTPAPSPRAGSPAGPQPSNQVDLGAAAVTTGPIGSHPGDDDVTVGDDDLLQLGAGLEPVQELLSDSELNLLTGD